MPDSGKFKDLYLNSAHTYPCQGGSPGFFRLTGRQFAARANAAMPGGMLKYHRSREAKLNLT